LEFRNLFGLFGGGIGRRRGVGGGGVGGTFFVVLVVRIRLGECGNGQAADQQQSKERFHGSPELLVSLENRLWPGGRPAWNEKGVVNTQVPKHPNTQGSTKLEIRRVPLRTCVWDFGFRASLGIWVFGYLGIYFVSPVQGWKNSSNMPSAIRTATTHQNQLMPRGLGVAGPLPNSCWTNSS